MVEPQSERSSEVFQCFFCFISDLSLSTGHQHSTFDWVHQRPQNKPQPWHHQCGGSLQGMSQIMIVAHVAGGMFSLHAVLTGLTLLSAHGPHHSRHRRPLWPVEPLLLEGQVRTLAFIYHMLLMNNQCKHTHYSPHLTCFISSRLKWRNLQWNRIRGGGFICSQFHLIVLLFSVLSHVQLPPSAACFPNVSLSSS